MINTTSKYKNPPQKTPYFRCKEVPMAELLLTTGYGGKRGLGLGFGSGSMSVDEGGMGSIGSMGSMGSGSNMMMNSNVNDFPTIGVGTNTNSTTGGNNTNININRSDSLTNTISNSNSLVNEDGHDGHEHGGEIPLTDGDINNILSSGYSHSRTRNHPELCSPMEPVFKALCDCYNMIEYERIVDPSIIQKSDKFKVIHTSTGEVRQTLIKPVLPPFAATDKYGRKSMNLLEKTDRPKGRPKSPSMINLNGNATGSNSNTESVMNSPSPSVPGSPAGKKRPINSPPGSPAGARPGSQPGPDKTSRKFKGSAGTKAQKPRVLVWSHLGLDRAATLVIAYLIRRWNISIEQSIEFIKRNRPGITISPFHMRVLCIWEKKFLCGNYVCMDCLVNSGGVTDSEYSATRQHQHNGSGKGLESPNTTTTTTTMNNNKNITVIVNDSMNKTTAGLSSSPVKTSLTVSKSPKTDRSQVTGTTGKVKYGFIEKTYKAFNTTTTTSTASTATGPIALGVKLGEVREFLHVVRTNHNASTMSRNIRGFGGDNTNSTAQDNLIQHSIYPNCYINLCDINLSGRGLVDEEVEILMEILLNIKIISNIRSLELQHNCMGDRGVKSIAASFILPEACFNEEIQLMTLNLSANM